MGCAMAVTLLCISRLTQGIERPRSPAGMSNASRGPVQHIVGRLGPDRPHLLIQYAFQESDLPVTPQPASLGDAQRSHVVRMNDRYDSWPPQIRSRVIENAPRGFSRVAVTPSRRIKRVAEIGRVHELYARRCLR